MHFPNYFEGFEELDWEAKFQKHQKYVADFKAKRGFNSTTAQDTAAEPESSEGSDYGPELTGCWLIKCDKLSEGFGADNLRLRIKSPPVYPGESSLWSDEFWIGTFDWDILSGVMHLANDPRLLPFGTPDERHVEKGEAWSRYIMAEEISQLKEQTASLTESLERTNKLLKSTLKAITSATSFDELRAEVADVVQHSGLTSNTLKRKASNSTDTLEPPAKRQHTQESCRMYFLWRGRDQRGTDTSRS